MTRSITAPRKPRAESTIALINIVFLMLIFFLIAGSLAPRPDADVTLVSLDDITTEPPSDALVILHDGSLRYGGQPITPDAAVSELGTAPRVRLLPDRAAPAADLLALAQRLRAAGVQKLVIVTERGH